MSAIRASLYGRLGSDPKPITTRTGNAMTRASLAVDVAASNAEQDETEWVTALAFGRLAEALAKHAKGDMVAVSGRFERNRWTGQGWRGSKLLAACGGRPAQLSHCSAWQRTAHKRQASEPTMSAA